MAPVKLGYVRPKHLDIYHLFVSKKGLPNKSIITLVLWRFLADVLVSFGSVLSLMEMRRTCVVHVWMYLPDIVLPNKNYLPNQI